MSQTEPTPLWHRGIVKHVDGSTARVRVELPGEDGILTDWLPVAVPLALGAKAYFLPRKESQVVVLLDELGEDGVVVGAIYSQADPPPVTGEKLIHLVLEDGTKITLDPDSKTVTVDTPGHLVAKAGQSAHVECPQITLKGAVSIEGTLTVSEAVTMQKALTVAQDATIMGKQFSSHTHNCTAPGSPSGPPI